MSSRAYTPRRRPRQSEQTRERVLAAVRELLHEGTFHESTVEEVADRAGIARIASGLSQREALARLMVLTSYDAYRELKAAGQSDRDVARTLRASALSMLTESA